VPEDTTQAIEAKLWQEDKQSRGQKNKKEELKRVRGGGCACVGGRAELMAFHVTLKKLVTCDERVR